MTASTVALAAGPGTDLPGPAAGANAETLSTRFGLARDLDTALGQGSRHSAHRTAVERGSSPEVFGWLDHVQAAAACTHPVRLAGTVYHADAATGEITGTRHTSGMPDGVIYKACGNRRATVCPACAETYRRDAYQLIRTGMTGGKGLPTTYATHPAVFATFTAPSYGLVHGHRTTRTGQNAPCRPRRTPDPCPHGIDRRCNQVHTKNQRICGTPLCLDCYDYDGQVVFNLHASELWRRLGISVNRWLAAKARNSAGPGVRVTACKVAEIQARGAIHFHAIFRLDGHHPDLPGTVVPPPVAFTTGDLTDAITHAARLITYTTPDHPNRPGGWRLAFGTQLDIRPVTVRGDAEITDSLVAGYFAKYATKSTEITGHTSGRLTGDTIDIYADTEGTHTQRLVAACWNLGEHPDWARLRRWAHMLGFGGHFLTKSRRYSLSFRELRQARTTWRRTRSDLNDTAAEETTLIITDLRYAGTGWRTHGDALLANTSANLARIRAQAGKEDLAHALAQTT